MAATTTRNAEWRKQSAALKERGRAWRAEEEERRKLFRALVKPAQGLGIDLKQMTQDALERFERGCAEADAALPKTPRARKRR